MNNVWSLEIYHEEFLVRYTIYVSCDKATDDCNIFNKENPDYNARVKMVYINHEML